MSIFRRISAPTKKVKTLSDRVQNSLVRDIENLYNISGFSVGETTADTDALYNAMHNGSMNAVFVGNSITEGVNAQMEGVNIYTKRFSDMFSETFPNITFNYRNYGLDSRKLSNFIDDNYLAVAVEGDINVEFQRNAGTYNWQEASVVGKSWMNHVRDFHPDIVFIHFGMNDTGSTTAAFKTNIETAVDKVRAFGKVPTVALVTDMFPTKSADPWQDRNWNIREFNRVIREVARDKNCMLLDVGRKWQDIRDGQDPLIVQDEVQVTLDSLTQIVGGTPADTLTFERMDETTNSIIYATETDEHRVVGMTCDYIPKTASGVLQMGIRFSDVLNETWAQGLAIQLRDGDIKFWENGSVTQTTVHAAITATNTHAVEFNIAHDTITVKVDTVTIGTYNISSKFDYGNLAFGVADADADNVVLISYDMLPELGGRRYSNNELTGNKSAADWTAGDKGDGGNGLNHPSRIGLREVFYPVMSEFIENL